MVATVFSIVLNAFLVGSFALFLYVLVHTTLTGVDSTERWLWIAALFAGAMITLGAHASGADFATFTARSLAEGRTVSAGASLVSAVIPGLMGVGLGFYVVRTVNKGGDRALRVLSFIGSLAITAFIGIYVASVSTEGLLLGPNAVPNVAFTTGVILTVVFTYDRDNPKAGSLTGLRDVIDSVRTRKKDEAPTSSSAFRGSAGTSARKDPFDVS